MNTTQLPLIFGIIYCIEQYAIGWYGWRNPRPKLMMIRKFVSALFIAWGVFSTYTVIVGPGNADVQRIIAESGMMMYVVMNVVTVVILGVILLVVRKKYFERVKEVA